MDVREKLVELLTFLLECEIAGDCSNLAKDWAENLISHGVTVQEWISVKERLPEYGQPVLVCDVREDYVGMAALQPAKHFMFSKSEAYWDWDRMECNLDEFTHWQNLLQPPKGE